MKISKIQATSRISTKIKDTFYTFEYTEERVLEDGDIAEKERADLWETCHKEVDKQVEDVINLVYKKN